MDEEKDKCRDNVESAERELDFDDECNMKLIKKHLEISYEGRQICKYRDCFHDWLDALIYSVCLLPDCLECAIKERGGWIGAGHFKRPS